MKVIKQLGIILGISFIGEMLNYFIPLPIPASIYGLIIMLTLLLTGALKTSAVKEASSVLLGVMPIMFIPSSAGIIEKWPIIKPIIIPAVIVCIPVTIIVMVVTGHVTQAIIKKKEEKKNA